MEKINWADHVRNKEVFHRVKEEESILQTAKGREGKLTRLVTSCLGTAF
jgi:hypothetical protein